MKAGIQLVITIAKIQQNNQREGSLCSLLSHVCLNECMCIFVHRIYAYRMRLLENNVSSFIIYFPQHDQDILWFNK